MNRLVTITSAGSLAVSLLVIGYNLGRMTMRNTYGDMVERAVSQRVDVPVCTHEFIEPFIVEHNVSTSSGEAVGEQP